MNLQVWGITSEKMERYIYNCLKTMCISGVQDSLGQKRDNETTDQELSVTTSIQLRKDTTKEMGLNPFQIAAGNMSETYENPDGQTLNACMYCSFCTRHGCDFSAKSDPLATVVPTAEEHDNFELRTGAYVRRVLYDKDNK